MTSKSVRFDNFVNIHAFEKDPSDHQHISSLRRESGKRNHYESLLVKNAYSTLNQAKNLFVRCRDCPISIVFGNLGRQPHLLTYYLDLCFSSSEQVGVISKWPTGSPYQVEDVKEPLDFLIILEPYFGYNVVKPSNVGHLIVLSSHLCLLSPGIDEKYFILHLAEFHPLPIPTKRPHLAISWTPPIFFDSFTPIPLKPKHVHLNVTCAESAHEAYLRLLTGRELLGNRPYSMDMNQKDEDILSVQLDRSERSVRRRWRHHGLEEWYWKGFKRTPKPKSPFTFILKRNPLAVDQSWKMEKVE